MLPFQRTSSQIAPTRRAFSLVEILVMITVIAVIAGIAIPLLSNVFQRSQEIAARRNAQQLAGVASTASAAGNLQIATAVDKKTAVELLTTGVNGTGQFSENVFMVRLDEVEREKTLKYLEFSDGTLAFDPEVE